MKGQNIYHLGRIFMFLREAKRFVGNVLCFGKKSSACDSNQISY